MKTCIVYFSQTGNTKMFADEISKSLKIEDVFDMTTMSPSDVATYDLLILGTPVHGFNPSKESVDFVQNLPNASNKKSILFCTCRLWKGRVFGKLKKELKNKGYKTVLCVDVKAKEFTKADFVEPVKKIENKIK
jgi:flavodoxin